jgi:uncharacterized membrane protein YvbJ
MTYCQNCGAERVSNASICPYCGYIFNNFHEIDDKEIKIKELEQKLAQLENSNNSKMQGPINPQMKYFWIMATIMVIAFFAFLFFFVYMARSH